MLSICECMIFDDDELLVIFCIMQIWCDDIFILFWINYGDVGFMPILMSDDDVFVLCCFIVESHTLHCRRWAFMPSDEAFMPSVPNYGQSDGYHMHHIVVSHGVGYVYVWTVWCWVLIDWWWLNCDGIWCLLVMVFRINMKWIRIDNFMITMRWI